MLGTQQDGVVLAIESHVYTTSHVFFLFEFTPFFVAVLSSVLFAFSLRSREKNHLNSIVQFSRLD
jgi:hypothetical protein